MITQENAWSAVCVSSTFPLESVNFTTVPEFPEALTIIAPCVEDELKFCAILEEPVPMKVPPLMVPVVSKSRIDVSPLFAPEIVILPPVMESVPLESMPSPFILM